MGTDWKGNLQIWVGVPQSSLVHSPFQGTQGRAAGFLFHFLFPIRRTLEREAGRGERVGGVRAGGEAEAVGWGGGATEGQEVVQRQKAELRHHLGQKLLATGLVLLGG